jgi:hypothetical protein
MPISITFVSFARTESALHNSVFTYTTRNVLGLCKRFGTLHFVNLAHMRLASARSSPDRAAGNAYTMLGDDPDTGHRGATATH